MIENDFATIARARRRRYGTGHRKALRTWRRLRGLADTARSFAALQVDLAKARWDLAAAEVEFEVAQAKRDEAADRLRELTTDSEAWS